ncbi:MAG: hypothetical protein ABIA59_11365, partial [Candidatus Latescibacterota bacterium]
MRFLIVCFMAAILLLSAIVPAMAGGKCTGKDRPKVDPDEIIYDLTIPWPFHHARAGTDADGD